MQDQTLTSVPSRRWLSWLQGAERGVLTKRRARTGYAFVAPAVLILVVTNLIPLLATLYLSFTEYNLLSPPQWVGLGQYESLFQDTDFRNAIGQTLYFTVAQVPLGTAIALLTALLLNRDMAGRTAYRTIVYLPQATSYVVIALIWVFLYDPINGPLNIFLTSMGGDPMYWLTDERMAMPSLVIMSIWRNLGYYMVIYLAALQSVPQELHEAAAIDGASAFGRFLHITIPLIAPVTAFIVVTWTIGALQMFTQAYVMTGGGPVGTTTTIVFRLYEEAFLFLQLGRASAMAMLFLIAVAALGLLGRRFIAGKEA